jgi:hypothetical protein
MGHQLLGGLARLLCAYEKHSKPMLDLKYRKDIFHEDLKDNQSINICFQKPATADTTVSLVFLLFYSICILLDHFDSLCAISLGHLTRRLYNRVHAKAVDGTGIGCYHHDRHHRGENRLASLAATPSTKKRWLAVVSVHPAGHPGADFAWNHYSARSACQFSRSYSPLTGELSGVLCRRFLWGWAARGNWLAWLRAAPHATTLWSIIEHTAPGCLVGFMAFTVLPDTGSWGRSRH